MGGVGLCTIQLAFSAMVVERRSYSSCFCKAVADGFSGNPAVERQENPAF